MEKKNKPGRFNLAGKQALQKAKGSVQAYQG
jgi:hypothetical protein